ncbi:MAG: glycosyltransferase 87 family protein [Ruthenibacterium sp.]
MITKAENRLLDFAAKHILMIVCVASLVLSLLLRAGFWAARTEDYIFSFLPWVAQMNSEGLAVSLREPLSNYSPFYILLLWLFTRLPVSSLTAVKLMATTFDFANVALLVLLAQALCRPTHRRAGMAMAFCLGCLLPIPLLNSAYWAQCDAIYTAFLLAATLFLVLRKEPVAILLCAAALCFKLQAVFFLPVLLILYCTERRFSALWLLSLPAGLFLSGVPTALAGGSIWAGIIIYTKQTDLFGQLTMNYPNFYTLTSGGDYELLSGGGVFAAIAVLGGMLGWLIYRRCHVRGANIVLLCAWCTLACTLFLPAMHERYGFFAELVLWIYFIALRDWRGLWMPALLQAVTLVTYANYFWGNQGVPGWLLALVNYMVFAALTQRLLRAVKPTLRVQMLAAEDFTVPEKAHGTVRETFLTLDDPAASQGKAGAGSDACALFAAHPEATAPMEHTPPNQTENKE